MDQLSDILARKFSVTAGENDLLAVDPAHAYRGPRSFADRKGSHRQRSLSELQANIIWLRHPVKTADVRSIGENTFVIKFNHLLDRKKALRGSPWVLKKHALILEAINPSKRPEDQVLIRLPNVVRVLQLSQSNRSKHETRLPGNSLGEFVEVLKESESHYSPYFRIKVFLDVT